MTTQLSKDGLPIVVAHHSSGSKITVHTLGATVTSFVNSVGKEYFFVSSKAVFDGIKAIRGGIPIVFPWFGKPPSIPPEYPQHGFARTSNWSVETVGDGNVVMSLADSDDTMKIFPHKFKLQLSIKFDDSSLWMTLAITNNDTLDFSYHALFHNYLVSCRKNSRVDGLRGIEYYDKVKDSTQMEDQDRIVLEGEIDRVYHVDQPSSVVELVDIIAEKSGKFILTTNGTDIVVWNPGAARAAAIADLGDDDYELYSCVEPGFVHNFKVLSPSQTATLEQRISYQ